MFRRRHSCRVSVRSRVVVVGVLLLGAALAAGFLAVGLNLRGSRPAGVALTLSDTDILLVRGHGFPSGAEITVDLVGGDLTASAPARADPHGRFLLTFTLPMDFSGTVSVTARSGAVTARGSLPVTVWDTRGKLSGLPWLSGVHMANELPPYLAFGAWRGRPIDVAMVFTIRDQGWGPISEPSWPLDDFAPFPGKLVISQPPFPEGQGGNAECARGAYDGHWRQFGAFLVRKNRADSIVRIGWEFNGTYMYWHADANAKNFTECFRRIATAIRSTDPMVKIDWTFNAHNSPVPSSGNPWDAYPGDEYVDVVGIDAYDHYPPSRDEATWKRQCESANGLCHLIRYAREHSRKVGVGEWGVTSCSGDGGGDNSFYVRKMYDTFVANADVMGYESYFHDSAPDNVCSAIMNGGQNARSAAEYRRLFGGS